MEMPARTCPRRASVSSPDDSLSKHRSTTSVDEALPGKPGRSVLLRFATTCLFATLYFGSPSAHAFCTEFDIAGVGVNCVDEGHKKVTGYLKPFMRPSIWSTIWNGNYAQDNPFGSFANDGQRHFQSCLFRNKPYVVANIHYIDPGSIEYIRDTYSNAIAYLDPLDPNPLTAADRFGKLLHTVQDFYSHTNWINLLDLSAPKAVSSADLFEGDLEEWPLIDWLGPVRDDIILGQVPPNGLPYGWSVSQALNSEIPVFATPEGQRRGIVTGWNENGACPDVREGETIDDYVHLSPLPIPRSNRLTHGESKIAGQTDFVSSITSGWIDAGYQANRPCHDGYPTWVCLQKDTPGRPDYGQAIQLAKLQTAQEWCRLLHLTKNAWGYPGSSILMALWGKPADEPFGPQDDTACSVPPEVLAGKAGPIEVTVDPDDVSVNWLPVPDGSPGGRTAVLAVYTGDFRRATSRQGYALTDESRVHTDSVTMCVKPTDKLVATIWGWDDFNDDPYYPELNASNDRILRGPTWVLEGPGFQPASSIPPEADLENQDMYVGLHVRLGGDDPDGDGLTTVCGETYYGTSPSDADTDDDGLNDGDEVNTHHTDPLDADSDDDGLNDGDEVVTYGTNPLDTDSDDDGLTDGDEVNDYGTNPANADSDGDGLKDGDEVNKYHTDPNKADTDGDGLPDGIEVKYGTNPLLGDTDGDGLPDGKDVEWIQGAIAGIPAAAIKSPAGGNRNAMINLLNDAEALLRKGNRKAALDKLSTLRSRIDGCGTVCDSNDWILDCEIQKEIRKLVDLLIANVR